MDSGRTLQRFLHEQHATTRGARGDAAHRLQRVDEAPHHRHVAFGILPVLVEGLSHEVCIGRATDDDLQLTGLTPTGVSS